MTSSSGYSEEEETGDDDDGAAGTYGLVDAVVPASVPRQLILVSPNEAACEGNFFLIESKHANDHPIWVSATEKYIFSSLDGRWVVGDDGDARIAFASEAGLIECAIPIAGRMPHEFPMWQREVGEDLKDDPAIKITLPRSPQPASSAGKPASSTSQTPKQAAAATAATAATAAAATAAAAPATAAATTLDPKKSTPETKKTSLMDKTKNLFSRSSARESNPAQATTQASAPEKRRWSGEAREKRDSSSRSPSPGVAPSVTVKKKADGEAPKFIADSNVPSILVVERSVERGSNSDSVTGTYRIAQGQMLLGFPVWEQIGGKDKRWIFSSGKETADKFRWIVGGGHDGPQGGPAILVSDEPHNGKMPNKITSWLKNGSGGNLVADQGTRVAIPPGYLVLKTGVIDSWQCGGPYLMEGRRVVNGYPIWRHEGGHRWLYTSFVGRAWVIGGFDEEDRNFECDEGFITNLSPHYGVMPDRIEIWQQPNSTGDNFEADRSIVFTSLVTSDSAAAKASSNVLARTWAAEATLGGRGTAETIYGQGATSAKVSPPREIPMPAILLVETSPTRPLTNESVSPAAVRVARLLVC